MFHICAEDGDGPRSKWSFLCPNGTIFNQEYFICDWWFNFDCSQATGLYSRNNDVAAERESASRAQASNNRNSYVQPGNGSPVNNNRPIQNAQPALSSYGRN